MSGPHSFSGRSCRVTCRADTRYYCSRRPIGTHKRVCVYKASGGVCVDMVVERFRIVKIIRLETPATMIAQQQRDRYGARNSIGSIAKRILFVRLFIFVRVQCIHIYVRTCGGCAGVKKNNVFTETTRAKINGRALATL